MKIKLLLVVIWMIEMTGVVSAQSNDSLSAISTFINALGVTRQPPVNVQMRITSSSDAQLSKDDSFSMEVGIHLSKEGSYMRFGEIEQLMNDSIALMVSDSLEQIMILPAYNHSLKGQWMNMFGIGSGDSAVKKMNNLYRGEVLKDTVKLQSRSYLSGTSIAKESAQLSLDPKTKLPVQLLVTRRSLLLLDSLQVEELKQQQIPAERFLRHAQAYYLVKETQTRFLYRHIDQEDRKLPVTVADRVERDVEGEWKPVKAYEAYRLVNQTNQ